MSLRPPKLPVITTGSGAPPRPRWACNRASPHKHVIDLARALKPGDWFVWGDAPEKASSRVSSWRNRGMVESDVIGYFDEEGRFIIARVKDGDGLSKYKRYRVDGPRRSPNDHRGARA